MKKTSNQDSNSVVISTGSEKETNLVSGRLSKSYEAIEQLHQKDLDAFRNQDVDRQVMLVTDDCIMLAPTLGPLCGREAIRNYLNDKFREWESYNVSRFDQHFEEIKLIGDTAYEWGTLKGVYYMKNGGPEIFENSRMFRILRSQPDGSWKIARVMWHEMP